MMRFGRSIRGALFLGALIPAALTAQAAPTEQVRATRVSQAPAIDGILDEAFWSTIPAISAFRQREPIDGGEPSERTEVRIAFDENNLYFAIMLFDREPELIRRSILQREGRIDQDDRILIALDTYHDRRNAYIFELNPFGTQGDALISDESMTLSDWNWEGVYRSEGRITEEGWQLEVAIPFTTIRFSDDDMPEMGIAFSRSIRRKNEEVFWPHIGQRYRGGISQVSRYATLTGLEGLHRGRYAEVKPFATGGAQKNGDEDTDFLDDIGVDVKYALTSNLIADLTWNTDFAQVEADNTQINLTRFSLFFPEKREFFLERAGLFTFGNSRETEVFFSRRVGLTSDIIGGGRVTGQVGRLSVGALSLWTDDVPGQNGGPGIPKANNSVVRVRADVMPRMTVGGIFASRSGGGDSDQVFGVDMDTRFWGSSSFSAWIASQDNSTQTDRVAAGSVKIDLRDDRKGVNFGFTRVEDSFNPALGFVRRAGFNRFSGGVSFFPRFEQSTTVRRLTMAVNGNVYNAILGGARQSSDMLSHNMLSFQSGDWVMLNLRRNFERLEAPASIVGRVLDAGDYSFVSADVAASTNESREFSGAANARFGDFWSGTRSGFGGRLTWKTGPNLTLTGSVDRNNISLPVPDGDFSTTVTGLSVLAAISRDLFANALVQWDDVSKTLSANIRINWIHTPGSDLFIVFDTGYLTGDQLDPRDTRWTNRTGVVKLTWLKAF